MRVKQLRVNRNAYVDRLAKEAGATITRSEHSIRQHRFAGGDFHFWWATWVGAPAGHIETFFFLSESPAKTTTGRKLITGERSIRDTGNGLPRRF